MISVAVINQKGGVGKSTLATNLAAAAHLAGKNTIVIDLDTQGSALDWYARRASPSLLEGLAVMKADRELSLPRTRKITHGRDAVIFVGPPHLRHTSRAAAVATDVVVMPIRPGGFDLWASSEMLHTLDQADDMRAEIGLGKVRRLIVLNGASGRARITAAALAALHDAKTDACPVVIHNRTAFPEASSQGESVLTLYPRSPAADEISRLYEVIRKCVSSKWSAPRPKKAANY